MSLEPEGVFLSGRGEGLTPPLFQELMQQAKPFSLKVDYAGLPPPLEELDLVHLHPARRSALPLGTLVLCLDAGGLEFRRICAHDQISPDREARVARVLQIERPNALLRLDSLRWRLLGTLLVGAPGFPRGYAQLRRLVSCVRKLLKPFPCPISLGPPERLMLGVIEKYSHPGDVEQRVKLLAGGLEDWEGDLFARVLPPRGHLLVVGCAAGREAIALARQGLTVLGIDPAPGLIEAARRHAELHGLAITFQTKTFDDLTAPPDSFDAILCSIYEHIPTRRRRVEVLRKLDRLVAPNGVIILGASWYQDRSPRLALVDGLRWLLRQLLGERFPTEPGDRLGRHLSMASDARALYFYHAFQRPEEIRREIEAAGLTGEMDPMGPWIIRKPG